ncbi:MAG: SpoIIE family protein phosphatase [Cytophagales bacterium]|nr:SpoIIE family protein phosphatase [Cytophagales bacterium]
MRDTTVIAACDCTGHGVPGAFMSMIGSRLLDDIVYDKKVTDAAQVLNQLRKGVIHAFGKAGATGKQQDGMDMALISLKFRKSDAIATSDGIATLQYAGAYNPLYIFRNIKNSDNANGLEVIKADRQPVGYYGDNEKPFTNHHLQLRKGDTLYIFSDGYQDQFGGSEGGKFSPGQFRELLFSVQDKKMSEQHDVLDKTIEDWKGNEEQLDDILVIGVRI